METASRALLSLQHWNPKTWKPHEHTINVQKQGILHNKKQNNDDDDDDDNNKGLQTEMKVRFHTNHQTKTKKHLIFRLQEGKMPYYPLMNIYLWMNVLRVLYFVPESTKSKVRETGRYLCATIS